MSMVSSSPGSKAWRWPARWDTLRVKLFLAIAGANTVLALVTVLAVSWSFDQGFVDYLTRADEARLRPLVVRLSEYHQREGTWKALAEDRRRWYDFVRDALGGARTRRPDEGASGVPASAPAPLPASQPAPSASFPGGGGGGGGGIGDPLLTIDPRLMLFDADGKLLVGRDEVAASAVQKPIPGADGAVVGYLGYLPQQRAVASLERAFSGQQNRKFAALGAAMLVAGLLIAALLAHWLSRRIKRLAHGAAALIQGHYGMRLDVDGGDELAQLAQDFNQLAQTLEAAQRARQQWIADIAHELRTPLAVLRAEIEALQDGVRPLGPAGLGSLAQEVSQLTRLVEDLRMLSLSDVGALTYHKEAFDLGELVVDALGAHAHALSAKGIACAVDAAADVQVLGDADRLAQVVANLLQNTLRYTDAPGRLEVRLVVDAGRALLVWQDSSPGVPADDLPRLTERLFRVDASRSRAGGGTGLGLAITKAIVQAHGGEMVASASPLGGVRWEIAFPLIDSSARPNHG